MGDTPAQRRAVFVRMPRVSAGLTTLALVVFALLSATAGTAGLVGCASAPSTPATSVGATLEVANWTEQDLVVSVRGRVEATVAAQMRARVHYLRAGDAPISAAILDGDTVAETVLRLTEGQRQLWDIQTDGATQLKPAPLGDVVVRNQLDRAMMVGFAGRRLGRVFPGQARRFRDLQTGSHVLEAVGDTDELALRIPFELTAEKTADVAITFDGAKLVVSNTTAEPVEWSMNGAAQGRISAGGRLVVAQAMPGPTVLTAVGLRSKRPYETTLELAAGEETTWALDASQGILVIENTTGETIEVTVPGAPSRTLAVGETSEFTDVGAGAVQVGAVGAPSGHRYVLDVELLAGQRYQWSPRPVQHTLRVVNRTKRTLQVYVGEQMRGAVEPSGSLVLTNLPQKAFDASAYDNAGTVRFDTTADPSLGLSSTWVIQDQVGAIAIDNRRPEAVRVYLDAHYVGVVEARSSQTFTGVPVGKRMIEAAGVRSGVVLRQTKNVDEESLSSLRFEDPTGHVSVTNETSEVLRPLGALSAQLVRLRAGTTHRFLVQAGSATLVMEGATSHRLYEAQRQLAPEGELTWTVRVTAGAIEVLNGVDEAVAITVDGAPHGRIPVRESRVIEAVVPGRHRVVARGTESGRSWQTDLPVGEGAPTPWRVVRSAGRIVLENLGAERLSVTVDGRPLGAAEASAAVIFPDVLPGKRTLIARGETSGIAHRFDLVLRDAQDERVVVHPPNGTLIVDNQSGQSVEIRVDGKLMARMSENAVPAAIPVAAGPRVVELRQGDNRVITTHEILMQAGSSVHLPVVPNRVRLVVVNKRDIGLQLYVGSRHIGDVEAGASRLFENLAPGRRELRAMGAEKVVTHTEERTLFAGETTTWVLQ